MTDIATTTTETTARLGWQLWLATVTLFAVMLFGLWQMIGGFRGVDWDALPSGAENFRTGETTRTLEKRLDHALPARDAMIMIANAVRYYATGGTGESVRAGEDNWLFLAEEIKVDPASAAHEAEAVALLAAMHERLASRDIQMAVLLVPDKSRLYADKLRAPRAASIDARYAAAIESLQARGVPVVDLLADMQAAAAADPAQELYYRTDTHWNEAGAELAAKAVAAWSTRDFPLDGGTRFTVRRDDAAKERVGDLLTLIGLDHAPAWMRPAGDLEVPAVIEAAPEEADGLDDLFADESVPVVLLGTSYSQRANFADFLQLHLASKALNASKDGGGIVGAAKDYFADEAFQQSPPRLVVWEVPERFLSQPLGVEGDWAEQSLPSP